MAKPSRPLRRRSRDAGATPKTLPLVQLECAGCCRSFSKAPMGPGFQDIERKGKGVLDLREVLGTGWKRSKTKWSQSSFDVLRLAEILVGGDVKAVAALMPEFPLKVIEKKLEEIKRNRTAGVTLDQSDTNVITSKIASRRLNPSTPETVNPSTPQHLNASAARLVNTSTPQPFSLPTFQPTTPSTPLLSKFPTTFSLIPPTPILQTAPTPLRAGPKATPDISTFERRLHSPLPPTPCRAQRFDPLVFSPEPPRRDSNLNIFSQHLDNFSLQWAEEEVWGIPEFNRKPLDASPFPLRCNSFLNPVIKRI